MKLLIRWAIIAVAVWLTAILVPGITLQGGIVGALIVALVFGLINAIIKPIFKLLTCPLTLLTLGLFIFVINALMLMLTAHFTDFLTVSGFWWAMIGSILISIVTSVLDAVLISNDKAR
jgi:putative membrane protein